MSWKRCHNSSDEQCLLPVLPYFLIWAWIGWFALSERQRWNLLTIIGVWLFLVLLIGLRVEIGADWGTYLAHLYNQIDTA